MLVSTNVTRAGAATVLAGYVERGEPHREVGVRGALDEEPHLLQGVVGPVQRHPPVAAGGGRSTWRRGPWAPTAEHEPVSASCPSLRGRGCGSATRTPSRSYAVVEDLGDRVSHRVEPSCGRRLDQRAPPAASGRSGARCPAPRTGPVRGSEDRPHREEGHLQRVDPECVLPADSAAPRSTIRLSWPIRLISWALNRWTWMAWVSTPLWKILQICVPSPRIR